MFKLSARALVRLVASVVIVTMASLLAPSAANALERAVSGNILFDDARTMIITTPGVGSYPTVSYDRGETYTRIAVGETPARCGVYILVEFDEEPGYAFGGDFAPLSHTFPCVSTDPNEPCAKVFFYGAAGSGQSTHSGAPHNRMGQQVDSVYQQVKGSLRSGLVEGRALPYAAASVWTLVGASGVYFDSISVGVFAAKSTLRLQALLCPTQRIVLAGYSQGAMVMHRVVQDLASTGQTGILDRIDGVVLIADGDRLKDDNVTAWGTASRFSQGVGQYYRLISGSQSQKISSGMQSRVHSICNTLDPVCAVLSPVPNVPAAIAFAPRAVFVHAGYTGSRDVTNATDRVVQRLRTTT